MSRSRSGAALIIAIVVLAAMLLLGLPFLFTQSGSLSGTRSYAHSRLASMGQDSAQSMGVAAGASAVSYRWQSGGVDDGGTLFLDDWSDLFHCLGGTAPDSGLRRIGINRVEFDTRNHTFALPGSDFFDSLPATERDAQRQRYPTVVGLAIEDESGKLDPNHLNIRAWTRLLQAVGIADWTDGRAPVTDEGRKQLARALSVLRYQLPGGRITNLEQLLQAEPPATSGSAATPMPKPRRGLTRLELDRLRPYLTVHSLAQARGGMIDLGTVLGVAGAQVTLDHDEPQAVLAHPTVPQLIGIGTTLIASDPYDPAVPESLQTFTMPAIGEAPRRPRAGAAMAIDAPPAVNLHQAEEPVRRTFAPAALPPPSAPASPGQPPRPSLLTDLAVMPAIGNDALGEPRTAFDLLAPLAVIDERGTTHVVASRQGDPGVSGAYNPNGVLIDPNTGNPILQDRASLIRVVTGSLDLFPTRGYAKIFLNSDPARPSEIIEYRRSVPDLPLSSDAVADRVQVELRDVRRGLNGVTGLANGSAQTFPSGTDPAAYDNPADLHMTVLVAHEQHPVGIASQGVVTIASTATVTDAAGNQTAQDQHRVVAQALPQERPLEARFDKQAALHALIAQRHGSLLTTFPSPYPRLGDVLPQDGPNVDGSGTRVRPYTDPADPERSVGVRPATLRTLLTHSHLDHSWRLPFAGNGNPAANPPALRTSTGRDPLVGGYTAADFTPEGLRLDPDRVLAYPNPGNAGFLRDSYPTSPSTGVVAPLEPLHGRQFGLWVRPDAAWTSAVVLFDMQLPDENVAESLSGELRPDQPFDGRGVISKGASNLFRLHYEPQAKLLILSLNPGTVQQVNDYGPFSPRELFGVQADLPLGDFAYPAVNPECLGTGGLNRIASAPPSQVQSIQHCTYVGDAFVPGDWHLIQVAFTSNQPGGMAIIVDGLVGRDVTRLASAATPAAMTVPGDHLTLPTLVLRADIADTPTVAEVGARALYLSEIPLDAIARAADNSIITGAAAVHAVLPKRGIVRIADEYISYDGIDAAGALQRCVRGRRQRTDGSASGSAINWGGAHKLQAHRRGDLVVPGGFAMKNLGGNWFRGGCSLRHPFPDGDPLKLHRVSFIVPVTTMGGSPIVPLAEHSDATTPQLPDLPPHGFLLWNQQTTITDPPNPPQTVFTPNLLYFDRASAPAPGAVHVWHWNHSAYPDPMDPSKTIAVGWVEGTPPGTDLNLGTELILVSAELAGDPTVISRSYDWLYANLNDNPLRIRDVTGGREDYDARMVQLYDARDSSAAANGGRAEWIIYTGIESRTTFPLANGERRTYLMNLMRMREGGVDRVHGGFWFNRDYRTGARGRQRTAFAASDFKTGAYDPALHRFPAGTRVIPVQTTITSPDASSRTPPVDNYPVTFLLEAGDVVTLTQTTLSGDELPLQMCVRYSANDGFPEVRVDPPAAVSWNTMNRFFAFTEAIPPTWNPTDKNFHMLSWPCWTPENDLSPLPVPAWSLQRLGWLLPWGNAYAPKFVPNHSGTDRPLYIGLGTSGGAPGIAATIDAVHAGGTNGWSEDNGRNAQPTELVQANILPPAAGVWLDENPVTQPVAVRADAGIFAWPYGLVDIGGEVFAYRRNTAPMDHNNAYAYLIGRGLLGSQRLVHEGRELVLHLPLGPVAEVRDGQPLALDRMGRVDFNGYFSAPAMLLTSRNGDVMEITTMPNSHTAPWLRGLYNTAPVAWNAYAEGADYDRSPIAIGWWPRYASALPHDAHPREDHFSELMRCRSYAWAGFPLRFHDSQFTADASASVTVLSNGDGLFDIHATALDATLDWSDARWFTLLAGSGTPSAAALDASEAFNSTRFITAGDEPINTRLTTPRDTLRPVDGAELRLVWSYATPRLEATLAPPMWLATAARNGNRAPMIGPVYVRTHAPNKVLNVER